VQDLLDEDGMTWPVTLSMSSSGIAKRMFILEKIGKKPSLLADVCSLQWMHKPNAEKLCSNMLMYSPAKPHV